MTQRLTDVKPRYPVAVRFSDGEQWLLCSDHEIETTLEWFDSRDPTEDATVTDADGRSVELVIERQRILVCALRRPR